MALSNLVSDIFLIAMNKSSDVLFFKIKPQLNISTSLSLHCLDINNSTELLELHYDDLDFELGPAPYHYLKLKYPIHSVQR